METETGTRRELSRSDRSDRNDRNKRDDETMEMRERITTLAEAGVARVASL